MKKTTLLTISAMLALAFNPARADDKAAQPHWSYSGKTDATHWAELDEVNSACRLSRQQSPINIDEKRAAKMALPALEFNYPAGAVQVVNTGHTVQVNVPPGSTLMTAEGPVNLRQLHFHTPSEEKINGVAYPMVAHFVHASVDGKLSVVAVLFKQGKENATLVPVLSALPADGKSLALESFDPAAILPSQHGYFKYTGSLTTPPCSDGVRWHVLRQPVEVSKQQIAAFRKLYPMNARPIQPLNGRVVQVSQ